MSVYSRCSSNVRVPADRTHTPGQEHSSGPARAGAGLTPGVPWFLWFPRGCLSTVCHREKQGGRACHSGVDTQTSPVKSLLATGAHLQPRRPTFKEGSPSQKHEFFQSRCFHSAESVTTIRSIHTGGDGAPLPVACPEQGLPQQHGALHVLLSELHFFFLQF